MSDVVLVCGGRDYGDYATVCKALERLDVGTILQGGATGADRLARRYAGTHNIPYHTESPDWNEHGEKAGPIRNARMVAMAPDIVLAFPGGSGTADLVRRAIAARLTTWILRPDGTRQLNIFAR